MADLLIDSDDERRRWPPRARRHVPDRDRALRRGRAASWPPSSPGPPQRSLGGRCPVRSHPGREALADRRLARGRAPGVDRRRRRARTCRSTVAWAAAVLAHFDAAAGRAEACRRACRGRGPRRSCHEHRRRAGMGRSRDGPPRGRLRSLGGGGPPTRPRRRAHRVAWVATFPGRCGGRATTSRRSIRSGRTTTPLAPSTGSTGNALSATSGGPRVSRREGRAMLTGDLERALVEFDRSVDLAGELPAPFEVARSRLNRGERLIEAGATEAATDDLRNALDVVRTTRRRRHSRNEPARLLGEPMATRSTGGSGRSADAGRATCRPRGRQGCDQPGGRGRPVRQRQDRRLPLAERLSEAQLALAHRARRCGSPKPRPANPIARGRRFGRAVRPLAGGMSAGPPCRRVLFPASDAFKRRYRQVIARCRHSANRPPLSAGRAVARPGSGGAVFLGRSSVGGLDGRTRSTEPRCWCPPAASASNTLIACGWTTTFRTRIGVQISAQGSCLACRFEQIEIWEDA